MILKSFESVLHKFDKKMILVELLSQEGIIKFSDLEINNNLFLDIRVNQYQQQANQMSTGGLD